MDTPSDHTSKTVGLTRSGRHVFLERDSNRRYLVNTSRFGIHRLQYSTVAYYFDMPGNGDLTVSARPYYEITDLPSGTKVPIEDIDPYEDGSVSFFVEEVEWEDGLVERNETLASQRQLYHLLATRGMHEELGVLKEETVTAITEISRTKNLLKTSESHTVYAERKAEDEQA